MKGAAPTPTSPRTANARTFLSSSAVRSPFLFTRETLRTNAEDHGGEHDDGQAAEDRAPECADQHLYAAQHDRGNAEAHKRGSRHEHEHEGIDQPGNTHVWID